MRRLGTALGVAAAAVAVIVMAGATGGGEQGKTIKLAFDNAFGLTQGGDLRIGGVKAGQTKSFTISKGPECQGLHRAGPPRMCAVVTAEISTPGFGSFRSDAHCDVRQQSLIGEYYVECQPGSSPRVWPVRSTLPVTHTTSTVPADLVAAILRRPYRDRLRILIAELGTGLAGRPQALAEVLRRADPGLRETDNTLRILAGQTQIIKNFISDSDTVVGRLDASRQQLARWVSSARTIAEAGATRQRAITAGWRKLPAFLGELKPTMARLNELTAQQRPLLGDLQRSAPPLRTFFRELGPFADASRPAFRSLGDLSQAGLRTVRNSSDEVRTLRQFAKDAPAVAKPLRQFLQVADNRNRERHWPDVRAMQTAPPPPDPTADARGKSFTGMESFWNYFFWQALALNEFDSVSHYLRTALYVGTECAPYTTDARPVANGGTPTSEHLNKTCNAYMGPYQPGINTKDPTDKDGVDNGAPGGKSTTRSSAAMPAANSLDSKAGKPAATTPLPGQIDPSQPRVVLPGPLADLLDAAPARPPAAPAAQPPSQATTDQLLNYLLAP